VSSGQVDPARLLVPLPHHGLAEKVVMPRYQAQGDSYGLVCRAAGVLMRQGSWDFDDALDELLGLAIRRGEKLAVTADLVVRLAESGRMLGPDR
jgi:hypothetical protein